jgi:hypothetical protein
LGGSVADKSIGTALSSWNLLPRHETQDTDHRHGRGLSPRQQKTIVWGFKCVRARRRRSRRRRRSQSSSFPVVASLRPRSPLPLPVTHRADFPDHIACPAHRVDGSGRCARQRARMPVIVQRADALDGIVSASLARRHWSGQSTSPISTTAIGFLVPIFVVLFFAPM